jgi:sugar phosphate isomerase/epimerase
MNRRQFLLSSSMVALAATHARFVAADPTLRSIGIQLFSVPKTLEKDFRQGIGMLAGMGYKEVEFYGPYPFSAPAEIAKWNTVTPQLGFSGSGFFGLSTSQARSVLDENRMTAPSMHTDLITLQTKMSELSAAAHTLGANYVVLPAIPQEKRQTLDDYKKIADAFNVIGDQARREGLRFAYHNHGYGLQEMQGQVPLKLILEHTDRQLVFLEMDIYWMTAGGGDPVEYLRAYPGRYRMMHLKDMQKLMHFKGDGGDPAQWIELFPNMTTVGDGVLDIKSIVAQAHKSKVEHLFVEQDMVENPKVALQRSIDYLKKL